MIFFQLTKLILQKFARNNGNRQQGALGREVSKFRLLQGCQLLSTQDLFLHKKMVESMVVMMDDFMNSSFCHSVVFREISDNPINQLSKA